jgi:hypothetical protein
VASVDIANAGLLKLGTSGIASLTDGSTEARAMSSCYDRILLAELRAHPWKFAIKRGTIPQLSEAPAWGYPYQYQLPADYLALVEVGEAWCWDREDEATWKIEGRRLLTRIVSPVKLRWVALITDAAAYDALFVEALACKLAHEVCQRLTQSDSSKDRLLNDYGRAIREARRVDAIERAPEPLRDTSWISERV